MGLNDETDKQHISQEYVHGLYAAIEISDAALTARDRFPQREGWSETREHPELSLNPTASTLMPNEN